MTRFATELCRFSKTLPQCGQADGPRIGTVLDLGECESHSTWQGASGVGLSFNTLACFPAIFFNHRLWDGYSLTLNSPGARRF